MTCKQMHHWPVAWRPQRSTPLTSGGSLSIQSARRLNLQLAADDLQANTSLAAEWRLTSPPDMGGRRCIAKATPLTSGGIAVNPVRTQTESSTGGSPVHRENYTIDTKRTCKRAGCQPTRCQSAPCPDAKTPGQSPAPVPDSPHSKKCRQSPALLRRGYFFCATDSTRRSALANEVTWTEPSPYPCGWDSILSRRRC